MMNQEQHHFEGSQKKTRVFLLSKEIVVVVVVVVVDDKELDRHRVGGDQTPCLAFDGIGSVRGSGPALGSERIESGPTHSPSSWQCPGGKC